MEAELGMRARLGDGVGIWKREHREGKRARFADEGRGIGGAEIGGGCRFAVLLSGAVGCLNIEALYVKGGWASVKE
jgi:hypothetical protein